MANTFSQVYLHIIFAVKGREAFLPVFIRPRIHRYIGGIIRDCGHIPIAVGGPDDHVHILIAYNLTASVPELVRTIKTSTSVFINSNHLIAYRFSWQRGYACFSHSHSQVDRVSRYIANQVEHHKNMTVRQEIIQELERRGISYDPKYLFEE